MKPGCNHPVHHAKDGKPLGSWIRKGDKIVCGKCGRFYGYVVPEKKR